MSSDEEEFDSYEIRKAKEQGDKKSDAPPAFTKALSAPNLSSTKEKEAPVLKSQSSTVEELDDQQKKTQGGIVKSSSSRRR